MKKSFKGAVKPYFYLDAIRKDIFFEEVIDLEEQHFNHLSVTEALHFGWLTELNKKKKMAAPRGRKKVGPPMKGATPQDVEDLLLKQAEMIRGMQKSYDSIQKRVSLEYEVQPHQDLHSALKEMAESQKLLLDVVNKKHDPQAQANELLLEIKNLLIQQSKPSMDPSVFVQVLTEIKENLKNQPTRTVYNSEKQTETGGFKVQDVEDTYIAKVGDLDVKNGKIMTETHSTSGTDDALTALKKLKDQNKK